MANTTWNPSDRGTIALSNGNLTAQPTGQGSVRTIQSYTAGKFYFEIAFTSAGSSAAVGVANATADMTTSISSGASVAICNNGGAIAVNGTAQTGVGAFSAGGACCVAFDMGAKLVWFRNGAAGNWNGSGTANPATGVGGYSVSGLTGGATALFAYTGGTSAVASVTTLNAGDTAFVGAVPSGFTVGLPVPVTDARATQVASEQWIMPNANAQATQVLLEMWAPGGTTQPRAVATLVALEQWASSGLAVTSQQARAWILA